MTMREKSKIMDAATLKRCIMRIAHQVVEKNKGTDDLCIIGIRNRGAYFAERLAAAITQIEQVEVPVGVLDITLYRDDLTLVGAQPIVHKTELCFDITGKRVVLADDVLYTGRTVRAALDALIDFGRPKQIQLAVVIDRGHRELPIRADFVGKNIPTSAREAVEVRFQETDERDEVVLVEQQGEG